MKEIDNKSVNNLRYLSATMIANAGSGHTGISLGATPIFYALYKYGMNYFPTKADHYDRDRLVLDSGHASALYYATLHAFGFNITKQDLVNYRKMGQITKGHPSVDPKFGIDASGGPLGQGIPMAVGMAIAEKKLASRFNKPDCKLVDHYTFCFAGDGGMMEGVTNEASSLAGTLGLNKLIVLYDSNNITIEGNTNLAFTENVLLRYKALGWNTLEVENGEDVDAIAGAIAIAKQSKDKPTIIKINTEIGFGTPFAGQNKIHGMALTMEQLEETRKTLGVNAKPLEFEKCVQENLNKIILSHNAGLNKADEKAGYYAKKYPTEYTEFLNYLTDAYSKSFDEKKVAKQTADEETRVSGGIIINEMAKQIPNLIVGSADLAPSTKLEIIGGGDFSKENPNGRNLHFGIREHAMGAIANGIALHGGFKIAVSTFMVFSDYLRHAIRMSALMKLPVIYVFTHDSIGVGEDGKTHQPVEYNAMYRNTPELSFFRPADRLETLYAYKYAINADKPTIVALSRQKTLYLNGITNKFATKGAYIVYDKGDDFIVFTSGSELGFCVQAVKELSRKGKNGKVVSVLSMDRFFAENKKYVESVLNKNIKLRIAVEASNDTSWYKFVGMDGFILGVNSFGFTASAGELYKHFKLTKEDLVKLVEKNI